MYTLSTDATPILETLAKVRPPHDPWIQTPPRHLPVPCAPGIFLSFLVGAVELRFAHRRPHACHQLRLPPATLALTLHRVFGPRGPFLHSGLSVLPHVTHTCMPPSPSLPAPAPPTARDAAFFLARFFSRAASLSFSFVAGSLGGRPGPAFGRGSWDCACACAAKAGEEGGEVDDEDGVGEVEGERLYDCR